jgi:cell division protein FtsQ
MTASRRAPLRRSLRVSRPGPRVLVALVALVLVAGGVYLWLRDSSLVAVQRVRITGVSGPDAGRIRTALSTAARNMTTLDVKMDQLRTAVAPYPVVQHLEATTQFPHGMTIHVTEHVPVATVLAGGRRIAVSADGTLLHDVTLTGPLPTIVLSVPPGGARLAGPASDQVRLLAAAPYRLLARIASVSDSSAHGLTAALRAGPSIYFGTTDQLALKWSAAVGVLADHASAGALYIDVSVPARPAAGGATDTNAAPATGTNPAPAAPTGTAAAPTSTGAGTTAAPTAGTVSTSG